MNPTSYAELSSSDKSFHTSAVRTEDSSQMHQSIVLVDDDFNRDLRLLRTKQAIPDKLLVIDIRSETKQYGSSHVQALLKVTWLITQSLVLSLLQYRTLARVMRNETRHSFYSGTRACIRWLVRSVHAGNMLKMVSNSNKPPRVVYAHDLYCAAASLVSPPTSDTRFIYDTHELQIHRNRKTGLLRILIEYGLEQQILHKANEVRVVNQAILNVMKDLYQMPATVCIEYNDHYTHHPSAVSYALDRPVLAFVGRGVQGRQLDVLDRPSAEMAFDVHVYLLGARLPRSISGQYWHYGPEMYEEHLLALARSRRSMMWCCVDTTSMSYKLATPNKFFQALAMGIPIIASKGTYLADIVHKYRIGAVFDGSNLSAISRQVMSPLYTQWVSGTEIFRVQLRSGELVI